ncbi:MAG: glycosyltransferase family 4 protein [Candidatus Omnitrophota bacterium]|nr:glycosyltransferase family 4 protein [Candidatus Omnitrophota bacterium]
MKICHLITRLIIGGAQENTLFTCYGLNERGHRVTLLTGPPLGPEGSLLEEARNRGLEIRLIPALRRRIDPLRDLISFCAIYRYLRREKPDVLHTHSAKAGILGRLAAGLMRRRPRVIHTIHGLPFHPYQNRILNFIYIAAEKMTALFTDRYISVADNLIVKSLAAGIGKKERYDTIYSGFAVEEFAAASRRKSEVRYRYGFRDDEIIIGKVARLFHLKGHEFLLPAFAAVKKEFPQSRLFLVGDGILKPELEELAENLGVREAITFAGLLSPREIPEAISAMDLLVHVSLREGLPKAVAQALAGGVPVVAFDVDGTREVVIDGVTGFLVPPQDSEKLVAAIISALHNSEKSQAMARAGQQFVLNNFAVNLMVSRIEAVYEKVLDD